MADMEDYEKLRGELGKIFLEGDKDELLFDLLFDSIDSKSVLEIAKEMKNEGNSLFNLGKFEDALEKYGNAEVILVGYKFEEKADRIEFCDLSLCILLNSSACFSKLREFDRVGQVCSIILDFQPNNIKAMYRRAMAAVELGRLEWAYWDLVLAAEISPNNQDVVKKLAEVKNSIQRKKYKDQNQDHCPKGIASGLPPQKKKSTNYLTKEKAIDHKENQEQNPPIVEKEDAGNHFERIDKEEEHRNSSTMEFTECDHYKNVNGKEMEKDEIKDEEMEEAGQQHPTSDQFAKLSKETECESSSNLEIIETEVSKEKDKVGIKDEMMEDAGSQLSSNELSTMSNDEKPNSTQEPTYRFYNRKRRDYNLSISKSNYLLMSQGKSLKFYNARMGSLMEVRIVSKLEEKASDTSDYHHQEKASPMQCEEQSQFDKGKQGNADSEEVHSEVGSCVTTEDDQPEYGDGGSTGASTLPRFSFTINSEIKARRKSFNIKSVGSSNVTGKHTMRRKLQIIKTVSLPPTNSDYGCRFEVGKKRKCTHLPPRDFCHYSKKRNAPHICQSSRCITCPSYCINTCNVGSSCMDASMLESVNPCTSHFG